jgi:hypothetical protein
VNAAPRREGAKEVINVGRNDPFASLRPRATFQNSDAVVNGLLNPNWPLRIAGSGPL